MTDAPANLNTVKVDLPITEPAPAQNGFGPVEGHPDGFNAAWYAHANPDVVAAGMDLLSHYQQYGKAEGRAPYEGGPGVLSATAAANIASAGGVKPIASQPIASQPIAAPALVAPPLPDGAVAAITIYGDAERRVHFISRGFTLPQIAEVLDVATRDVGAKMAAQG